MLGKDSGVSLTDAPAGKVWSIQPSPGAFPSFPLFCTRCAGRVLRSLGTRADRSCLLRGRDRRVHERLCHSLWNMPACPMLPAGCLRGPPSLHSTLQGITKDQRQS